MPSAEPPAPTVWDEAERRRPRRRQVPGWIFWLFVAGIAAVGVAVLWAAVAAGGYGGAMGRLLGTGLLGLLALVGGWEISRWSPGRDRRERARAARRDRS